MKNLQPKIIGILHVVYSFVMTFYPFLFKASVFDFYVVLILWLMLLSWTINRGTCPLDSHAPNNLVSVVGTQLSQIIKVGWKITSVAQAITIYLLLRRLKYSTKLSATFAASYFIYYWLKIFHFSRHWIFIDRLFLLIFTAQIFYFFISK